MQALQRLRLLPNSAGQKRLFCAVGRCQQCTHTSKVPSKPTAELVHQSWSPCEAGNARDVVGIPSTEAASSHAGHPLPRDRWSPASKVAVLAACSLAVACCAPSMAHAAAAAASSGGGESFVSAVVSFILHLDKHMSAMIARHGTATYAILWGIVFCETGLVLTPFLPGDSLLFAAGAFAGMGKLSVPLLMAVFISSAILGDAVNYAIGNKLGRWALERKMIKEQYIKQTRTFYAKYGGKTVVLARFVPIVRTFAPFVAGIGSMAYSSFAMYNVAGALLWTVLFVGAGFFFGNLPVVQHNFTLVVLAIVAVSVLPVVFEVLAARREGGGGSTNTLNSV